MALTTRFYMLVAANLIGFLFIPSIYTPKSRSDTDLYVKQVSELMGWTVVSSSRFSLIDSV